MTVERLHFGPGRMTYDSMLAAEHVVRYQLAADLAPGQRVLDIACGEGYGSAMLAEAGAAQVLGIDIAPEAVAVAQERFARPGLEFRTAAAEALADLADDARHFDLIVSFETIEHVADPARFLRSLVAVLAPGGSILISAPNEGGAGETSDNPFHRRAYSLASFRAETETVLGPARAFLLGMPVQGFGIADAASGLPGNDRCDLAAMLEGDSAGRVRLLPAQRYHRVGEERASFFLGVWGRMPHAAFAVAPIAEAARVETYEALTWLRAENARQARAQAEALLAMAPPSEGRLQAAIAALRRAELLDRERLDLAQRELRDARAALHQLVIERDQAREAAVAPPLATPAAEPEAQARAARAEAELAAICASRSWRVMQAYVGIYDIPVIGGLLRRLRATAGRVWRLLRPRRPAP